MFLLNQSWENPSLCQYSISDSFLVSSGG
jgi:hypothetical protein